MNKKHSKRVARQKPTLKTVAKALGINPSTVSRVINSKEVKGKFTVSPELRKEILDTCHRLNYRPNVMARAIKTKKTMTIGAFGYLMSPYFYNMLLPAQREASRHGYTVTVHARDGHHSIDEALEDMFGLWEYDGIWAVGSDAVFQRPIVDECALHNVPLVLIGQPLGCAGAPSVKCVGGDFRTAHAVLINYLYQLGHTKFIVFMRDPSVSELARMYLESFQEPLKRLGIPLENMSVVNTSHDPYEANELTQQYFKSLKKQIPIDEWPTVVIATTQTIGTLHGIQELGISVPDEMSFITTDNTIEHLADHLQPRVAAQYEPCDVFGKKSIELLISMINVHGKKEIPFEYYNLEKVFRTNPSCIPVKDMRRKSSLTEKEGS